jgi:hypothetical protein
MHGVRSMALARSSSTPTTGGRPGMIWMTLEAAEIIDLKRIVLDRDAAGAVDLFRSTILPRVRAAALERRIGLDLMEGALSDDGLPG